MSRVVIPAPAIEELSFLSDEELGWVEEIRSYRLLTPLWGGGAVANTVDKEHPVSEKGIRGQLRFWWRATRGGAYPNIQKLAYAEDRLWGAPSKQEGKKTVGYPSQVIIEVVEESSGTAVEPQELSAVSYLTFPLDADDDTLTAIDPNWKRLDKPDKRNLRDKVKSEKFRCALRKGIEFKLRIRYSSQQKIADDVRAALWAWETFGGVGARTRRGFGAIERTDEGADKPETATVEGVKAWLNDQFAQEALVWQPAWPVDEMEYVPHLAPKMDFRIQPNSSALGCWSALVGKLKKFRQDDFRPVSTRTITRDGRTRDERDVGQTDWPDADSVRLKTGTTSGHPVRIRHGKFPRAAFGLPIIFHFKEGKGDPADTTLQGADYERMSSRLILRPLACQKGYVGLALILESADQPPGGLALKITEQRKLTVQQHLSKDEASAAPSGRTAPLSGNPNVLQAFLNYLK